MSKKIDNWRRKNRERQLLKDNTRRIDTCFNSLTVGIDTEMSLKLISELENKLKSEFQNRKEKAEKELDLINNHYELK